MFNDVLVPVLLLSITIQLGYALYFFGHIFSLANSKVSIQNSELPISNPVTVIICAKNEAENLRTNLPVILAQRYSNASGNAMYKVLVVNDASADDTALVLDGFKAQYPHLETIYIANDEYRTLPGKKYALSKALVQADTEYLLLTDADCLPASDNWLAAMVAPLHDGIQIVAGYGAYQYNSGMLNAFIRWETLHTFIQYAGYALSGKPYMAVGRNLACTKTAMLKAQESAAWSKLPSGDDDLLVQAVADAHNMSIVARPYAVTISPAKQTWATWLQQKQRHVSTGKYYNTGTKLLLALYSIAHSFSWISCIILLFTPLWQMAFGVMLVRMGVNILIQQQACRLTGERNSILLFLLADVGWIIYNFVLTPYILFKNKTRWT